MPSAEERTQLESLITPSERQHRLRRVISIDTHPAAALTRPYRRWFQGVIASLRRVFLMVSCRRGFVEGEC